jgi:4'-phosphopantetheinyl transferase
MDSPTDPRGYATASRGELPDLSSGEIHVWRIPLESGADPLSRWGNMLSESERKKTGSFRNSGDGARHAAAHGWLRRILAAYTGLQARELEFMETEFGKPFLKNNRGGIRFNMSHSGGGALVAVSRGRDVGVDMEFVTPAGDLERLAGQCFSPREIDLIRSSEDRLRTGMFYAIWTRKEAYIKARGEGMSLLLNGIDCAAVPAVLDARWHVIDLGEWGGSMCALASDGPAGRVRFIGSELLGDVLENAGAAGTVRGYRHRIRGAVQ